MQRVGSNQTISVDVRLIAATHRDLAEEVSAGRFRRDLYYRLNVVAIEMPSLRQRREDIPLLADHFLRRFAERNRKAVKGFTPQAMDLLIHYDWPGNIRELENAIERAVVLLTGEYISERELPLAIAATPIKTEYSGEIQPLVEVEKEVILAALEKTGGNKTEAARQLGITRKTLLAKNFALALFAFDGAPADVVTAEAAVPADVGHQGVSAFLRFGDGVAQRGGAQDASAAGQHTVVIGEFGARVENLTVSHFFQRQAVDLIASVVVARITARGDHHA